MKKKISEGRRYGNLVALEFSGRDRWRAALWRFRCDCGNDSYVARIDQVQRGVIQACGCKRQEWLHSQEQRGVKHGHTAGGKRTSEYVSWRGMLDRCHRPTTVNYVRYGGRGIKVCEQWLQFEHFLADMGKKPSRFHTVDRIDNDGNYEPGNCRWQHPRQQNRNRVNNRHVVYLGQQMTLAEACELQGINRNVVDSRLRRGWTPERAVTTPVKYHKPR